MSYRSDVVHAALKEMLAYPNGRPQLYWQEVLNPPNPSYAGDFCGAFVLRTLKQAGLAKNVFWDIGVGFIEPQKLPRIAVPMPGDIVFIPSPFEHQAVVIDYNPASGMVTSVDANQPGTAVKVRFVGNGNIEFYDIQPLIDAAAAQVSPWTYLVAGAVIAGAAAYAWLNPGPIDRALKRIGI